MLLFLLLGLLQGLTEFLPISSSGHLALAERVFRVEKPGLLFDALVHLGTVGSVLLFYRSRLTALARSPWRDRENRRLLLALSVATVPTVLLGVILAGPVERAFASPGAVALGLLFTGAVLLAAERVGRGQKALGQLPLWGAVGIGVAQGLAVFPGVSRSGLTIAAALWLGLERSAAAEFSFLLAVPAILGAVLLQGGRAWAWGSWEAHAPLWGAYLGGMAVAFIFGVLAIGTLIRALKRRRLGWFAYYCWALALAIAIWIWILKT